MKMYFEDGLLNFIKKQTIHSNVIRLQRYWKILGTNFVVDSLFRPKSVLNTTEMSGQQYRLLNDSLR